MLTLIFFHSLKTRRQLDAAKSLLQQETGHAHLYWHIWFQAQERRCGFWTSHVSEHRPLLHWYAWVARHCSKVVWQLQLQRDTVALSLSHRRGSSLLLRRRRSSLWCFMHHR